MEGEILCQRLLDIKTPSCPVSVKASRMGLHAHSDRTLQGHYINQLLWQMHAMLHEISSVESVLCQERVILDTGGWRRRIGHKHSSLLSKKLAPSR